MPTTPRLHVVTGKGGTGKTTVAAALSLALSAGGQRVLLIEVEGRQGLAQLFDRAPMPYVEQRLAAGRGGEVLGLAVDAEAAMLEYLDMFYNIKRGGSVLRRMGAIDFVTTIAPGLRDVLLTGKVKEAVIRTDKEGRPTFDAVVLDAPPTGRITHFLDTTTAVAGLTKFGPIYKQSVGVSALLHSEQTVIHLVTLLEDMPVQETLDAAADLTAGGYHLGRIVVNRARPELVATGQVKRGAVDQAALAAGLAQVGIADTLVAPLARQLEDYAVRQRIQVAAATELEQAQLPIVRLPELPAPMDLGSLFELADALDVDRWMDS